MFNVLYVCVYPTLICFTVDNMILRDLQGVDFLVANTDAQHLSRSRSTNTIQIGRQTAQGLGCGANPDAGKAAALESLDEIMEELSKYHMVFITAGMGGGTGTGAAPVIAEACLDAGILTVAVVTKPFNFEGRLRTRLCNEGISHLGMGGSPSLFSAHKMNMFV